MALQEQDQDAFNLINTSQKIAVMVPQKAGVDEVASAMALYHVLTTAGKQVFPIVPERVPNACLGLPESSQIRSDFESGNLVIQLGIQSGGVEQLSYSGTEGDVFEIIVHQSHEGLVVKDLNYHYKGEKVDLIIVLGATKLEQLGTSYQHNKQNFASTPILSITTNPTLGDFADTVVTDTLSKSIAETLFHKLSAWGFRLNPATAECLLVGTKYGSKRDNHDTKPTSIKEVLAPTQEPPNPTSPYPTLN